METDWSWRQLPLLLCFLGSRSHHSPVDVKSILLVTTLRTSKQQTRSGKSETVTLNLSQLMQIKSRSSEVLLLQPLFVVLVSNCVSGWLHNSTWDSSGYLVLFLCDPSTGITNRRGEGVESVTSQETETIFF